MSTILMTDLVVAWAVLKMMVRQVLRRRQTVGFSLAWVESLEEAVALNIEQREMKTCERLNGSNDVIARGDT